MCDISKYKQRHDFVSFAQICLLQNSAGCSMHVKQAEAARTRGGSPGLVGIQDAPV